MTISKPRIALTLGGAATGAVVLAGGLLAATPANADTPANETQTQYVSSSDIRPNEEEYFGWHEGYDNPERAYKVTLNGLTLGIDAHSQIINGLVQAGTVPDPTEADALESTILDASVDVTSGSAYFQVAGYWGPDTTWATIRPVDPATEPGSTFPADQEWTSSLAGATPQPLSDLIADLAGEGGVRLTAFGVLAEPDDSATVSSISWKGATYRFQPVADRLGGEDRYATAIAIAESGYPEGADTVFVATGEDYPDALSAAPAAVAKNAPILLTPSDYLPSEVVAEIGVLDPDNIVVVGGPGAVSPGVLSELSAMAPTHRVGGDDRFDTSRAITMFAFESTATAYISTGMDFPDALSAGAAGGATGSPVILVNGTNAEVSEATIETLDGLGVENTFITGGVAVVSEGIEDSLSDYNPVRLAGDDRYGTSVVINDEAFTLEDGAYLATGFDFPDALAGAALAGSQGDPLYTVRPTCVPSETLGALTASGVENVTVFGETGALSEAVAHLVECGVQ